MILAFHKPYDVLCQFTPGATPVANRRTLADFIDVPRVYPAGRLDRDSEGLLILTDEGEAAHRLTDPAFDHPKTYLVQVEREPNDAALARLEVPARRVAAPAWLAPREKPIRFRKNVPTAWIEIVLREGKNRQVRRRTASIGHPTLRLVRVRIGDYPLEPLRRGEWRELDRAGRDALFRA